MPLLNRDIDFGNPADDENEGYVRTIAWTAPSGKVYKIDIYVGDEEDGNDWELSDDDINFYSYESLI
jgi:hypothetical protein